MQTLSTTLTVSMPPGRSSKPAFRPCRVPTAWQACTQLTRTFLRQSRGRQHNAGKQGPLWRQISEPEKARGLGNLNAPEDALVGRGDVPMNSQGPVYSDIFVLPMGRIIEAVVLLQEVVQRYGDLLGRFGKVIFACR